MEQVTAKIVNKMVLADLIAEDESELYYYGVQVVLEKSISYAIILVIAMIFHSVMEIALFFASFSIIRKYSGGIHCQSFGACLVVSALVLFSGVFLFPFVRKTILTYQGG